MQFRGRSPSQNQFYAACGRHQLIPARTPDAQKIIAPTKQNQGKVQMAAKKSVKKCCPITTRYRTVASGNAPVDKDQRCNPTPSYSSANNPKLTTAVTTGRNKHCEGRKIPQRLLTNIITKQNPRTLTIFIKSAPVLLLQSQPLSKDISQQY